MLSGQSQALKLARPFGRCIAQVGDPDAPRQASFECGLDESGSKKRHRDRSADMTDTTIFALGNSCDIVRGAGNDLVKPLTVPLMLYFLPSPSPPPQALKALKASKPNNVLDRRARCSP